ncbi:cyclohexanone monooxygenase, partial [Escherichia fergusonii]|nr:cyclohexanone monooxygenase [Escherichia fergusonii]
QQAKELTVFQRTPNFCVPARNGKVDPEVWAQRKQSFDKIVDRTRNSFFGFELDFIPQSVLEASPEEREATFN